VPNELRHGRPPQQSEFHHDSDYIRRFRARILSLAAGTDKAEAHVAVPRQRVDSCFDVKSGTTNSFARQARRSLPIDIRAYAHVIVVTHLPIVDELDAVL
jgi:hypothetical protein